MSINEIIRIGQITTSQASQADKPLEELFSPPSLPDNYKTEFVDSATAILFELAKTDTLYEKLRNLVFATIQDGIKLDSFNPKPDSTEEIFADILIKMLEVVTGLQVNAGNLKTALLASQATLLIFQGKVTSLDTIFAYTLLMLGHAYQEKVNPKTSQAEAAKRSQEVGAEIDTKSQEQLTLILTQVLHKKNKVAMELLEFLKEKSVIDLNSLKEDHALIMLLCELLAVEPKDLIKKLEEYKASLFKQNKINEQDKGAKGSLSRKVLLLALANYFRADESIDDLVDAYADNVKKAEKEILAIEQGKYVLVFALNPETKELALYQLAADGTEEIVSKDSTLYTMLIKMLEDQEKVITYLSNKSVPAKSQQAYQLALQLNLINEQTPDASGTSIIDILNDGFIQENIDEAKGKIYKEAEKLGVSTQDLLAMAHKLAKAKSVFGFNYIKDNRMSEDFFSAMCLCQAIKEKDLDKPDFKDWAKAVKGRRLAFISPSALDNLAIYSGFNRNLSQRMQEDPKAVLDDVKNNPKKYENLGQTPEKLEIKCKLILGTRQKGANIDRIAILLKFLSAIADNEDIKSDKKKKLLSACYEELAQAISQEEVDDALIDKIKVIIEKISVHKEFKKKEHKELRIGLKKALIQAAIESKIDELTEKEKSQEDIYVEATFIASQLDIEITEDAKEEDDALNKGETNKLIRQAKNRFDFVKNCKKLAREKGLNFLISYLKSREAQTQITKLKADFDILNLVMSFGGYEKALDWLAMPAVSARLRNLGADTENQKTKLGLMDKYKDLASKKKIRDAIDATLKSDLNKETKREVVLSLLQKLIECYARKEELDLSAIKEILFLAISTDILTPGQVKDLISSLATSYVLSIFESGDGFSQLKWSLVIGSLFAVIDNISILSPKIQQELKKSIILQKASIEISKKKNKEKSADIIKETQALAKTYEVKIDIKEIEKAINKQLKSKKLMEDLDEMIRKGTTFKEVLGFLNTPETQGILEECELSYQQLSLSMEMAIVMRDQHIQGMIKWLNDPKTRGRVENSGQQLRYEALKEKYQIILNGKEIADQDDKAIAVKELETLIAQVENNELLISSQQDREVTSELYQMLFGLIQTQVAEQAEEKYKDLDPDKKKKKTNTEASQALLDYLSKNKTAITRQLGKKGYLGLEIQYTFSLILAKDGEAATAKYIEEIIKNGQAELAGIKTEELSKSLSTKDKLVKMFEGIYIDTRKQIPTTGLYDGDSALVGFKRVIIRMNVTKDNEIAARAIILDKLKEADAKSDELSITINKEPDSNGNIIAIATYKDMTIEVVIKREEIGSGKSWKKERMYRELSTEERKAQEQLRDLGFLNADNDSAPLPSFEHSGYDYVVSAQTSTTYGLYDYATMQAMGMFNAYHFSKGKNDEIDARFTPENLQAIEEEHKQFLSTQMVIGVVYGDDNKQKTEEEWKQIVAFQEYTRSLSFVILGKASFGLGLLEQYDEALLLDIAQKLHAIKVSGIRYLEMAPEEAIKPENRQKLAEAMMAFYSTNAPAITAKKDRPEEAIDNRSEQMASDPKKTREFVARRRNAFEQEAAKRLQGVTLNWQEEYTEQMQFVLINQAYLDELNKQFEKKDSSEVDAPSASQGRAYLSEETALFIQNEPYAGLLLRARQLSGDPDAGIEGEKSVPHVLTIEKLKYIRSTFDPANDPEPYFHIVLSAEDRELLKDSTPFIENLELLTAFNQLIQGLYADPSKPWNKSFRVSLSKEAREALFDLYENLKTNADYGSTHPLTQLTYQLIISFSSDAILTEGDLKALDDLIKWMENSEITELTPEQDFYVQRETDSIAYKNGIAALNNLAQSSMIGAMFGSGVIVDGNQGFWTSVTSFAQERLNTARLMLSGQIDPSKGSVGVAGVEQWKIIRLKLKFYEEMGLDQEWKNLIAKYDQLKKEIITIKDRTDINEYEKKKQIEKILKQLESIESKINVFFSNLTRIDYEFLCWFIDNFSDNDDSAVADWIAQRFFEQKGFKSAFTKERITLSQLKAKLREGMTDPQLRTSGWTSLTPLEGETTAFADAKQSMALLLTLMPMDEATIEQCDPAWQTLKMVGNSMFTGKMPGMNIAAEVQSIAIMMASTTQRRNALMLDMLALKHNQVNGRQLKRFAEAFEEICRSAGMKEEYFSMIQALYTIAKGLEDEKIIEIDGNDLTDNSRAKLLLQAVFLINIMLQKNRLGSQGITVTPGAVGPGAAITGQRGFKWSDIGLPYFDDEWQDAFVRNNGDNMSELLGNENFWEGHFLEEAGANLATFGPFMGAYFGIVLPFNLGYTLIGRYGEEVIDIDPSNGMPRVGKDGMIQYREIGVSDVATQGVDLFLQLLMFRNFAPVFYNMLGIPDDLMNGNVYQAYVKFAIANFFMLFPGKEGFWDSTVGRSATFDRYMWKTLQIIEHFLRKHDSGTVFDASLEKFAEFFDKHPKLKELVKRVGQANKNIGQDAPDVGLLGAIGREISKTDSYRFIMTFDAAASLVEAFPDWFEKHAKTKKAIIKVSNAKIGSKTATALRFVIDPLGTVMRLTGEAANESRTASAVNTALNKLFEISFEYTRLTYWEGKAFIWVAQQNRRQRAEQLAKLSDEQVDPASGQAGKDAQTESMLRKIHQSQDIMGDFTARFAPDELIVRMESGAPVAQVGTLTANKTRLVEWVYSSTNGELLIKGVDKPLKIVRICIDSPIARASQHAITYAISRPSLSTPLELSEVEIHINSQNLQGADLQTEMSNLMDRARFMGIDHPQLKVERGLLDFKTTQEYLKAKGIALLADEGTQAVFNNTLKTDGLDKLIEFCQRNNITEINRANWELIRAFLADNLIENPGLIEAETKAQVLYQAAKNLTEGIDYTVADADPKTGRRIVIITAKGRKHLAQIAKQNGIEDFAICRALEEKAKIYIESEVFVRDVLADQTEIDRLKNLSDKAFTQEVEKLYQECGRNMTYEQMLRATRLQLAAVSKANKGKWTLNFRQIQAGYLASINITGADEVRTAIDLGTGEGKTITLTLPEFIAALRGDKLIIRTSTTDTYARDGYEKTKPVHELLGMRTEYIANKSGDSLAAAAQMAATGRVIIHTAFDTVRFQHLFDTLTETTGKTVLPIGLADVTIFLDESDYTIGDTRTNPAVVSGGSGKKAKDAAIVEEANAILARMGWIDERGNLTDEGKKYITNENDEGNIQIKKEGYEAMGVADRPQIHRYIRYALIAHKFYIKGKHYGLYLYKKTPIIYRFMNSYISRTESTGRYEPGQQYDASLHKAVLAKEGVRITDPGLSSVSIMPHVFLNRFGRVVLLSGTNKEMASLFAQDGYLSMPVESNFERTRIDLPAVMVRGSDGVSAKQRQMDLVRDWAIERMLDGHPVLIHVGEPGLIDPETDQPIELDVLNIKELKIALQKRLEEIKDYKGADQKMLELQKKLLDAEATIAELNKNKERRSSWEGEDQVLIQALTDVQDYTKESRMVARVGFFGVITISDTANRAVDPGREKAILEAFKDGVKSEDAAKGLVSIVTQWKVSMRHFIQEVNRICRPDPSKGKRSEGDMIAIYQVNDPNFKDAQVKGFLENGLMENERGIIVMKEVFPDNASTKTIQAHRQMFAAFMQAHGIIDQATAKTYIETGELPENHQQAIELVRLYRLSSDEALNRSLLEGSASNPAEDLLLDLDTQIRQIAEDPTRSFAEVFEAQSKKAVDLAMQQLGINDNTKLTPEHIKTFQKLMGERYGINIRINGEFTSAFELRQATIKAIEEKYKPWKDHPESIGRKKAIAARMLDKMVAIRIWLIATQNQINNPSSETIAEQASLRDIFMSQLPEIMEAYVAQEIMRGPDTVFPKLERQLVNGEVKFVLRWHTPKFMADSSYYVDGKKLKVTAPDTIDLSAIEPNDTIKIEYIESLIASKLKTLSEMPGAFNPQEPLTLITIEGVDYKFDQNGIKALNAKLEQLGSQTRIDASSLDTNNPSFIFGKVLHKDGKPVIIEDATHRTITFVSELAASSKDSLGYISIETQSNFGEAPKHEIVIRRARIAETYDRMVEAYFGSGKVDLSAEAFAYAAYLFELYPEVTGKETAIQENIKDRIIADLEKGTIAHEKGHEGAFRRPLPSLKSQYQYLSNRFVHSLYELIAEYNDQGRLAEAYRLYKQGDIRQAKLLLFEYLFMQSQSSSNPIKAKTYQALYRLVFDPENGIDFEKLELFRKRTNSFMENMFQATVNELTVLEQENPRLNGQLLTEQQKPMVEQRYKEYTRTIESMDLEGNDPQVRAPEKSPAQTGSQEMPLAMAASSDKPADTRPVSATKPAYPLEGKIKDTPFTFKANEQGRRIVFDPSGKAIGWLEITPAGKAIFRKATNATSYSIVDPLTGLYKQVKELIRLHGKEVQIDPAKEGTPITSLDSDSYERAVATKTRLLKYESLAFLKDAPIDAFAQLTGKDIRTLETLAKYKGGKIKLQTICEMAYSILTEKLGASQENADQLIEEAKWKRVKAKHLPVDKIRAIVPTIGRNTDTDDFIKNISWLGNPGVGTETKQQAKAWLAEHVLGTDNLEDPRLVQLGEISFAQHNEYIETKKGQLGQLNGLIETAKQGFRGEMPKSKNFESLLAFVQQLNDPTSHVRANLEISEGSLSALNIDFQRASVVFELSIKFKLNAKERVLLADTAWKTTPDNIHQTTLEKAIEIKITSLEEALKRNDLRPVDRQAAERDLSKLRTLQEQVKQGLAIDPKAIPELETEIKVDSSKKPIEMPTSRLETEEERTGRMETAGQWLMADAARGLEQAFNIKFPETSSLAEEFRFILEASDAEISRRYKIDITQVQKLKQAVGLLLDADVRFENCSINISIDPETGSLKFEIKTDYQTILFNSEQEAKDWLTKEIKEGKIKFKNPLLSSLPRGAAQAAAASLSMGLSGFIAEAFVNFMIEAYKAAVYEDYQINYGNITETAWHGAKSWTFLGIKMNISQALLYQANLAALRAKGAVTNEAMQLAAKSAGRVAMLYAIGLDLLGSVKDPDPMQVEVQLVSLPTSFIGFGGFIAGEWMVGKLLGAATYDVTLGLAATRATNLIKPTAGVLVSTLAGYGVQAVIGSDGFNSLDWNTQRDLVEGARFLNNRLESYCIGSLTNAFVNFASTQLLKVEASGPWGLILALTSTAGDGIMDGVYAATGTNYERIANLMTSYYIDEQAADVPFYYVWVHGRRVAKSIAEATVGKEIVAMREAEGSVIGKPSMHYVSYYDNTGNLVQIETTTKDYIVEKKCTEYREYAEAYLAMLYMQHMKVKDIQYKGRSVMNMEGSLPYEAKDLEIIWEFDTAAIEKAINEDPKLKFLLGFIRHFHPEMLAYLMVDKGESQTKCTETPHYDTMGGLIINTGIDKKCATTVLKEDSFVLDNPDQLFDHLRSSHRYVRYGDGDALHIPVDDKGKEVTLNQIIYKEKVTQLERIKQAKKAHETALRIMEIRAQQKAGTYTPIPSDISNGIVGNSGILNRISPEVEQILKEKRQQTVNDKFKRAQELIKKGYYYEAMFLVNQIINDPDLEPYISANDLFHTPEFTERGEDSFEDNKLTALHAKYAKIYGEENSDEVIRLMIQSSPRAISLTQDLSNLQTQWNATFDLIEMAQGAEQDAEHQYYLQRLNNLTIEPAYRETTSQPSAEELLDGRNLVVLKRKTRIDGAYYINSPDKSIKLRVEVLLDFDDLSYGSSNPDQPIIRIKIGGKEVLALPVDDPNLINDPSYILNLVTAFLKENIKDITQYNQSIADIDPLQNSGNETQIQVDKLIELALKMIPILEELETYYLLAGYPSKQISGQLTNFKESLRKFLTSQNISVPSRDLSGDEQRARQMVVNAYYLQYKELVKNNETRSKEYQNIVAILRANIEFLINNNVLSFEERSIIHNYYDRQTSRLIPSAIRTAVIDLNGLMQAISSGVIYKPTGRISEAEYIKLTRAEEKKVFDEKCNQQIIDSLTPTKQVFIWEF